ncbi:MAG: hypothetical protein R3C68_05345 [Myxococcota bacterium]
MGPTFWPALHLSRVALIVLTGFGRGAWAQPADKPVGAPQARDSRISVALQDPAIFASPHRVAASFEAIVDIYRLALGELDLGSTAAEEVGRRPGAAPGDAMPPLVAGVFQRLAQSMTRQVPCATPALTRAYHAEVIDALESLSAAIDVGGGCGSVGCSCAILRTCVGQRGAGDRFVFSQPTDPNPSS